MSYDLELAVFTVSSAGLDNLTKVSHALKGGSGGGGGGESLTRATAYSVGGYGDSGRRSGVGYPCLHTGRHHSAL